MRVTPRARDHEGSVRFASLIAVTLWMLLVGSSPAATPPAAGTPAPWPDPSTWERYRWWIVGTVTLVTLQAGLIGALLMHWAQRRRAQRDLAERLRFETLLSDLSARLSTCPSAELDREIEAALKGTVEDLGVDQAGVWTLSERSAEVRLTHAWIRARTPPLPAVIQENEAPRILARLRDGLVVRTPPSGDPRDEVSIELQRLAPFGARSTIVVPLVVGRSVVGGLSIGTVREERAWPDERIPRLRLLADLFASALARQQAEHRASESATEIQNLAGRLITAQEEERRRIARELHDGINQELAALSIALTALGRRPLTSAADLAGELARLQERANELVEDIRHVSHELHPGVLQHVGLVAALEGCCSEFEDEHGLGVTFRADEDLGSVPPALALCLYRATQEALRNVAKHAGAGHVRVSVARDGGAVVLTVADDGCGFDLEEARGRGGLGLISLEERARLLHGHVTIYTVPQRGTQVRIAVPLPDEPDAPGHRPAR